MLNRDSALLTAVPTSMQALGTIRNEKKGSDSNKDGGSLTIQFWAGPVSTAEITEVR